MSGLIDTVDFFLDAVWSMANVISLYPILSIFLGIFVVGGVIGLTYRLICNR